MSSRIILIVFIGLVLVLIAGGYFLGWPKYMEFKTEKIELETKDEEIELKEKYFSRLENYSAEFLEYANELAKVDTALPTDPSMPALFNLILKITAENGLILNSIDFGGLSSPEKKEGEGIQEIPFSFSVSGSYSALKNFLSVIYKNARLFEIVSITLSSGGEAMGGEETGGELFTFSLSLKTYAYQEVEMEEMGIEGELGIPE